MFENAVGLVVLFCGLAILFALWAGYAGGIKGFLTFIILNVLGQILPDRLGWLLMIVAFCLIFWVKDTKYEADPNNRASRTVEVTDNGINYGAGIFLFYILVNFALANLIFWQVYP